MRRSITMLALSSLFAFAACQDSNAVAGPDEFAAPAPAFALVASDFCDGSTMPSAECEVLVHLYNTTGGDSWETAIDHWGEDPNPCTWRGIYCTEGDHGSVREIHLVNTNLVGSIPPEIGQLSSLTELWLGANANLGGPLPATLADLQNLTLIELTGNDHSGPIPEWLGDLPDLAYFMVGSNDFSGPIPAELANAQSLEGVILDHNDLSGAIPPELGTLTGLRAFSASYNQLSGVLPLEFAALGDGMVDLCILWHNDGLSIPDVPAYRDLDTDGDDAICALPFSSPEDVGEDAVGGIEELVPDPLSEGLANALTTKIENALAKAANGQYQAAINQMMAFISQVEDMVANGVLTQVQADPFLQQAQALIDLWTAEL